jgi:hypothetical protein
VPNASFYSYNSTANSVNFVPKTSFLHVEGDFEICAMPLGLSVLPDTADLYLSWIPAESPVDDYAVFLNDSLIATTGDTFYTISNLAPNTPYSVKVASVCGTDYSPAVSASVRTACSQIPLPFSTSFENDPYGVFPPCWTRTIASGTDPSVNTVYAHTGTQAHCSRKGGIIKAQFVLCKHFNLVRVIMIKECPFFSTSHGRIGQTRRHVACDICHTDGARQAADTTAANIVKLIGKLSIIQGLYGCLIARPTFNLYSCSFHFRFDTAVFFDHSYASTNTDTCPGNAQGIDVTVNFAMMVSQHIKIAH